ncbi:hypothetical protein BH11PLA2_BH11PLA2_15520 [soil metagenome]
MPAVLLPKLIETKFEDLAQQVRRLRFYRGVSRLLLLSLGLAAFLIILDVRFGFSTPVRYGITLAWFTLILFGVWRLILKPVRQPLTVTTLAAAIETEFPSLSERLMTVVELSTAVGPVHGSKSLIDLLIRDTTNRTRKLKVDRAAPRGPVFRLMALATLFALLGLIVTLLTSGGTDRVKRFLLPWHTPRIDTPYTIKVSSGSTVVRRGDSVTLTGYLERKTPDAVLPTMAALVTKDSAGVEKKLLMTGDANAAFHITRPTVANGFDYRIEAGTATSDWFTVIVADAVDLADGTAVTITPPDYAVPPLTVQTLRGFGELDALQHSKLTFDFKFNRPANAAALEWIATAPGATLDRERINLSLEADRLSAKAMVTLHTSGSYRLVLTGEHGLLTTIAISAKATSDTPPKFDKAVGISDKAKAIRPDEKIILETAVSDDFKVVTLELEYVINDSLPVTVQVTAKDLGTSKAESKFVFDLNGKTKEGDTLKYRLKATDNRSVPTAGLTPQVTYFPEKAWSSVKISVNAESLDKQEIQAQKDAIQSKLEDAKAKVNEARQQVDKVKRDSEGKPLTPEQRARLETAKDEANAAAKDLDAAAKEAGMTPELRALSEKLKDAANDTVRPGEDSVRKAENEPDAKARKSELTKADDFFKDAASRMTDLQRMNEDSARNRQDKRRLEKLSDEVNKLAEAAKNADDAAKRDAILKKLQQSRDELRDVIKNNETLRDAAEKSTGKDAKDLANEAERLTREQKQLDKEIATDDAKAKQKAQSGNAKAQEELNGDVDELRKKTKDATSQPGREPLAKEPFDKAAEKLKDGNAVEAMTAQEKAAKELDKLAENLKADDTDASNKNAEAAAELSKKQRDLSDQTAKANDKAASEADPKVAEAQGKKQDDLAKEADKLAKKLEEAANAPANSAETVDPNKLSEAAESAKAAQEKMEKAAREQKAGHGSSAAEARSDSAKALEAAAKQARDAVKGDGKGDSKDAKPDPNAKAASDAAQAASSQLAQGGKEVGQKDGNASKTLKDAADKLGEAADKLGDVGKNPKPDAKPGDKPSDKTGENDGTKGKPLTAEDLPPDLKQYAGKMWGDLPGDVKSKIVQDLKAKYGEDYARVIKLYFEQQAEKK